MARLQFRHLDNVFENREDAIAYISDLTDSNKVVSTQFGESLIGEPLAVKYKTDDDKVHVILAIGKEGNKGEGKHEDYHIIDSAKYEEDIEELSGITEELKQQIEEIVEDIEELNERVDAVESAITELNERVDEIDANMIKGIEINVDNQWEGERGSGVTATVVDNIAKITLTTDNVRIADHYEGQMIHHDHALTDFIEDVDNIHFIKETEDLPANVREQYKLVDGSGNQFGDTVIKIYKDSSVYKAYIGHIDDTIVSPTDPTVVPGVSEEEALCIIYYTTEGTYQLVAINIEEFIQENEFGDGLQVLNHIVSVKIDESGEPFLTVSPSGIKLDGVQEAIDNAVEAEQARAEAAESAIQEELDLTQSGAGLNPDGSYIHVHDANYIDDATSLADADTILDTNLKEVSDRLEELSAVTEAIQEQSSDLEERLNAEIERATERENELDSKIDNEIERAQLEESSLRSVIDEEIERAIEKEGELDAKIDAETERAIEKEGELDTKIDAEIERATEKENEIDTKVDNLSDRLTAITGQEGDTYKKHNTTPDDNANYINVAESMDEADFILDKNLGELSAATVSEIERLDTKIDNVNSTLISQINEISETLTNEIERAQSAETIIMSAISIEREEREAADEALSDRINELEGQTISGENAISVETANSDSRVKLLINDEDKVLSQNAAGLKTTVTIDIVKENDKDYILLKGTNGDEISRVDATTFIKDGMLDSVEWIGSSNILQFTFNTDAGKEVINIDFGQFVNDEINRQIAALSGAVATINGDINTPNSTYYKIDDVLIKYNVEGSAVDANHTLIRYYTDAEGHKYYVSSNAKDMYYSGECLETVITRILNDIVEVKEDVTEIREIVYDLRDEIYDMKDDIHDLQDGLRQEIERATSAETVIMSAVSIEREEREAEDEKLWEAISGLTGQSEDLQEEIDRIEAGAGLDADGNYIPKENPNYISAATSINEAVNILDDELQRIEDKIDSGYEDIWSALTKEISDREEGDLEIWSALTEEIIIREENERVVAEALNDLNDRVLENSSAITRMGESLFADADYDSSAKTINFYNKNHEVIDSIDATDFIKDGMVDNVYVSGSSLVIVFNTDAGKETITIPLSAIFNPEDYYTKPEVDAFVNELESAITIEQEEREAEDIEIWSAITELREYSDARDDEIELIAAEAFNNLNGRIINISAVTNNLDARVTELENTPDISYVQINNEKHYTITSGDENYIDLGNGYVKNSDISGFTTEGDVNNIINNYMNDHVVRTEAEYEQVSTSGTLVDTVVIRDIIRDNELVVANALNDLNDRVNQNASAITELETVIVEEISSAITILQQDIEQNYYTKNETDAIVEGLFAGAEYISSGKVIEFYNNDGELLDSIDATAFIKDGMVQNVYVSGTSMIITFNTDAGKEDIVIPLSDIFDPDEYYTKQEVNTFVENLESAITIEAGERESEDNRIWSAITDVVNDFQQIITDAEFVISSSLNDLNDRMIELSGNVYENYYTIEETNDLLDEKQETLISGRNLKTINNQSLLGEGNIDIQGGGSGQTYTAGDNITISGSVISADLSNYYNKTQIDSMFSQLVGQFVKVTSAEYQQMYNAGTLDANTLYVIID